MSYNAIVRDWDSSTLLSASPGIVGRTLLTSMRQLPPKWTVQFRGGKLDIDTKIDELMCCPEEPMQIFKPPTKAILGPRIFVTTETGKVLEVNIWMNQTIEHLKKKIEQKECIPVTEQCIYFKGKQLCDSDRKRSLWNYSIRKKSTVHLASRRRGGGTGPQGMSMMNLETNRIVGREEPGKCLWNSNNLGLNLYGVCPDRTCISKQAPTRPKYVVVNATYGVVRMTSEKNKFNCTACQNPANLFFPKKFITSFGRSLFCFKKAGRQPKSILIESLGDTTEHKVLDEIVRDYSYDVIETTTVGRSSSPYFCVKCNCRCIGPAGKDSSLAEVALNCGHVYHKKCAPTNAENCFVCKADFCEVGTAQKTEENRGYRKRKTNQQKISEPSSKLAKLEVSGSEYYRSLKELRPWLSESNCKTAYAEEQRKLIEMIEEARRDREMINQVASAKIAIDDYNKRHGKASEKTVEPTPAKLKNMPINSPVKDNATVTVTMTHSNPKPFRLRQPTPPPPPKPKPNQQKDVPSPESVINQAELSPKVGSQKRNKRGVDRSTKTARLDCSNLMNSSSKPSSSDGSKTEGSSKETDSGTAPLRFVNMSPRVMLRRLDS